MPPKPGLPLDDARCPRCKVDQAVAVQGRFCGFISKAAAILIDLLFVTLSFAAMLVFLQLFEILFIGGTAADARQTISREKRWAFFLYCFYWGMYFFLAVAATGSTMGMAILGLKVVNANDGEDATVTQAALRTMLLPLSTGVLPILGVIGFYRRDGRMLHDVVANTGIIFEWEAQIAKVRALAMQRAKQQASLRAASTLSNSTQSMTSSPEVPFLRVQVSSSADSSGENKERTSYTTFA